MKESDSGYLHVEYQVREKGSGMTVAWADSFREALHYLSIYNQDYPHELYKATYERVTYE